MRSMTGFGRAEIARGGLEVVAEVRTLNQRFLELKLNLPRGWGEHEADIRKLVQKVVARGRVEVFLRCATLRPPPARLRVNHELARRYVGELRRLGRQLDLDGKPGIDALLHRPEIFQVAEDEPDLRAASATALKALAHALKKLDVERMREGASLRKDFTRRMTTIGSALPQIARLAENSRKVIMEKFQVRVRELLEGLPFNERRLYDEAASAAQHIDISEEMTRLRTHLQGLRALLGRKGPIGKPIEFLLQEINREVNTVGAKSQNASLTRITVELKGEIEKMREQVQNVE